MPEQELLTSKSRPQVGISESRVALCTQSRLPILQHLRLKRLLVNCALPASRLHADVLEFKKLLFTFADRGCTTRLGR